MCLQNEPYAEFDPTGILNTRLNVHLKLDVVIAYMPCDCACMIRHGKSN
jgi:hypothetical protein